jgi:hypothetical protein
MDPKKYSRRSFVKITGLGGLAAVSGPLPLVPGEKSLKVEVLNPFNRVPVSLIIDDATCLVNMAYYGIPQFAEVFPEQYKQDWRKLPREIPDSFVREFGEWALENGVKGKYSVVPYPACTGWVNRFIPGWTKKELTDSLELIRKVIMPNWDIHPEMVSHTRVIDIRTGKPYPDATPEFMENWEWSQTRSVDELAEYQAYALNVLKEAGLYCEGLTTPGGYGSRNQDNLALSTLESVRSVFGAGVPHYFRDVITDKDKSVAPRIFFPSDLESDSPKCAVSIIGCTDDWFGGWDGLAKGNPDNFITEDLKSGRMVDVIESGEPAIIVCHWPGLYFNGDKTGFLILREVKKRLEQKYDSLIWMKLSEIAGYWAAKELTSIIPAKNMISLKAPFSAPGFTLRINASLGSPGIRINGTEIKPLLRVKDKKALKSGAWYPDKTGTLICFDLVKGATEIISL